MNSDTFSTYIVLKFKRRFYYIFLCLKAAEWHTAQPLIWSRSALVAEACLYEYLG